MYKLEVG